MPRPGIMLVLCVLLAGRGAGQTAARADSAAPPSSPAAPPDSARRGSGIDTVVNYSCKDSIVYVIPARSMVLHSAAGVTYREMALDAERIAVDWNTSVMSAAGVRDTSDSTGARFTGSPRMKDGSEEYRGRTLSYNFRTKKGRIGLASTEVDQGFYFGDTIKKVDESTLFVEGGRYTTCDAAEPHYYFGSPRMKVILRDKIVAEPVYLYVADVPVFALPFGVFPNRGGRRSGIIAPAIVEDATHGRLLQHLGYYWAISDYLDLSAKTDLYTRGSWAAYSDARYAVRYLLSGGLSGEYRKIIGGEAGDPGGSVDESYRVNLLHSHDLGPATRANVNFTFASQNSFRNTLDLRQALDQSITSNATVSHSWEGTPNSVTLNVSRRQNLIDGSIDETLPAISFNHSQSYPFRRGKGEPSWVELLGVAYGAQASNSRSKANRFVSGIKTAAGGRDTVVTVEEFERSRRQSLSQNIGLNISPKLGYFTLVPSLTYREDRSHSSSDVPQRAGDSSLAIVPVSSWSRSGSVGASLSASTRFYGLARPGILGIAALRHTVTPALSLGYSKQVVGETAAGSQVLANMNVGNVFEMKGAESGEGKEPERIQLLVFNASASYSFSADSLRFSPIGTSFRTGIGEALSVDGSATFDLYKLDPVTLTKINTFLLSDEGRLARLTDVRFSVSTSLSGERSGSGGSPHEGDSAAAPGPAHDMFGAADEEPDFAIPWRLSLALDYTENKVPPFRSHSSNVRGNMEFNLTEKWKFSVSGGYDVSNRELVVPTVNVSRDLHCWLMNFSWVPLGTYRNYRFEIRIKAPQLQDVKVTKQGSPRGIY